MCDTAVDAHLSALKFVPDLLVITKMLEILNDVVFSNDDIDLDYIDSSILIFFSGDMGIVTIDSNNIDLDVDNFDDNDVETINHVNLVV